MKKNYKYWKYMNRKYTSIWIEYIDYMNWIYELNIYLIVTLSV